MGKERIEEETEKKVKEIQFKRGERKEWKHDKTGKKETVRERQRKGSDSR